MSELIDKLNDIKDIKDALSAIVVDAGAGTASFSEYPQVFASVVAENAYLSDDVEQKIEELSSMLVDFTEESTWVEVPYESNTGKFYKYTDGALVVITADTYSCQYTSLEVQPGDAYKVKTWLKSQGGIVFFKADGSIVSSDSIEVTTEHGINPILSTWEFTIPDYCVSVGISNVRYSANPSTIPTDIIEIHRLQVNTTRTENISSLSNDVNIINSQLTCDIIKNVDFDLISGYWLNKLNGNVANPTSPNSKAGYTKISVEVGEEYYVTTVLRSQVGICFYNSNNDFISGMGVDNTTGILSTWDIIIPESCATLGVACLSDNVAGGIDIKKNAAMTVKNVAVDAYKVIDQMSANVNTLSNETTQVVNQIAAIDDAWQTEVLERKLGVDYGPFDKGQIIIMMDDCPTDAGIFVSMLSNTYGFPCSLAVLASNSSFSGQLSTEIEYDGITYTAPWTTQIEAMRACEEFGGEIWSHSINGNTWSTTGASGTDGNYNIYPSALIDAQTSLSRLKDSKMNLLSAGFKAYGFVTPSHYKMDSYIEQVMRFYKYGRDVSISCSPYDIAWINVQDKTKYDPATHTKVSNIDISAEIDACAENKSILIVMTHTLFRSDLLPAFNQVISAFNYIKWGNNAHTDENIRTDLEVVSMKDIVNPVLRAKRFLVEQNAQVDDMLDNILS